MKKIAVLLTTVLTAGMLAACGQGKNAETTSAGVSDVKTEADSVPEAKPEKDAITFKLGMVDPAPRGDRPAETTTETRVPEPYRRDRDVRAADPQGDRTHRGHPVGNRATDARRERHPAGVQRHVLYPD